MAESTSRPGRLIAVDGTRGRDVDAVAETVRADLRSRGVACGISRWDASGLFGDLLQADPEHHRIAPRTLALAYAADLSFRLRWEIRPALQDGAVVIAAPYLDTVVAVAVALGVPEQWLWEVFRFADAPDHVVRAREGKPENGWKRRPERGFGEFCSTVLESAPAGLARRRARRAARQWLEAHVSARTLSPKQLAALAAEIRGATAVSTRSDRAAARSRRRSRSRALPAPGERGLRPDK
jgi:thymidylate kinase